MLSLTFLIVLMFYSILFSTVITLLGEERELVYMLLVHLYAHLACLTVLIFLFLFVSGSAADSDRGTPWTFRLIFPILIMKYIIASHTIYIIYQYRFGIRMCSILAKSWKSSEMTKNGVILPI